MKSSQFFALALTGLAAASPLSSRRHVAKREVPQEHSHEIYLTIVREFLQLDNPLGIKDPVFGLLGNAAAAQGVDNPDAINLDCLKQLTADQAFTNAKAVGDVRGMAGALVFQAIERNTGAVGQKSVLCPEAAANPEIAALTQHQDPASDGAAAGNKAITLELARQLALIGVDPLLALESGTFAPGEIGDPTGAGNSCDDLDDPAGCIFTRNLLVLDASPDEVAAAVDGVTPTFTGTGEILATNINFDGIAVADAGGEVAIQTAPNPTEAADAVAVSTTTAANGDCTIFVTRANGNAAAATAAAAADNGKGKKKGKKNKGGKGRKNRGGNGNAAAAAAAAESASTCSLVRTTVPAAEAAAMTATAAAADATEAATGTNVQAFTGTLGGAPPPVISSAGDRPFAVNGNTFTGITAALSRSCDIQHNACANAANGGALAGGVAQCETQLADCRATNSLKKRQAVGAFGSCSDPTIEFGVGFDGRREGSFRPVDGADFDHGSAQRIGIIADFVCQRLQDACKADAATVDLCGQASAAAKEAPQDETAAAAFNSLLTGGAAVAAEADAVPAGMVVVEVEQCS